MIFVVDATTGDTNIITTGFKTSASTNRNYGLHMSTSEIIIMMDDDIEGFYQGWADELIKPLLDYDDVLMVSARLMKPDGTLGIMVGENYDLSKPYVQVNARQLPTACIAFKKTDIRFDETFIGSGFEDNDFCLQLGIQNRKGIFIINNNVKLVHTNEMKEQGRNWNYNKNYFNQKYGISTQ